MPPNRSANFKYPNHIDRDSIAALPSKPGVYLFRDQSGTPVYIGKSVNIRSRVLAHMRTPEEAAMLQETRSVDFLRTAGEIGALLMESELIKKMQPAYNSLLRHIGATYGLRLSGEDTQPRVVGSFDPEAEEGGPLYGLFASRGTALEGLRSLIRQHRLCPALCGLETTVHGRACFSRQIGRCAGACMGLESAATHRARLLAALEWLEAAVWPYEGAIGIVEQIDGWRQTHVIDRWAYLGSLEGRRRTIRHAGRRAVDIDVFKILARPLFSGELTTVAITSPKPPKRQGGNAA